MLCFLSDMFFVVYSSIFLSMMCVLNSLALDLCAIFWLVIFPTVKFHHGFDLYPLHSCFDTLHPLLYYITKHQKGNVYSFHIYNFRKWDFSWLNWYVSALYFSAHILTVSLFNSSNYLINCSDFGSSSILCTALHFKIWVFIKFLLTYFYI